MKKIVLLLLAVALFAMTGNARTFVLVTGVSNYGGDGSSNLALSTKDAKRFTELMKTQTKDVTLLTSKYANKANILEKLRAICNRAQAGDRVIFYFSGHGTGGAIVTYGIELLSYDELLAVMNGSSASEKICFIDACMAGSLVNSAKQKSGEAAKAPSQLSVKAAPGSAFFVACRPDEYSWENKNLGAGFFTQALIKGMRGKADTNSDRKITIKELFKYIYGDVVRRSTKINNPQHPQLVAPKEMMGVVIATW